MKTRLALCVSLAACSSSDRKPDAPAPAPAAAPTVPPPDFSKLPAPTAARPWSPPAVETWQMANGVSVYFVPQAHVPLVSISLVVPRGACTDPPGKAGLTALMADLLDEGAAGRNALQLSEAWQALGADFSITTTTDAIIFDLDALADKVTDSLALFADVALRPDLSSVEFQRRKDQRIATALAAEADPASTRSVALRRVVFGQGYGALPADGLRPTLKGLDIKDVVDQYRAAVVPQGASLIVVGATDRATVQAELERAFGGWAGAAKVAFQAVDSNQPERAVYFVDHPGASQSAIAVAMRSESAQAPDLFESEVYNWTVGGAFTSRINLNLREVKGFTYGARSGFYRWSQAGFFSVGALVKAPHTRESVDEIFKDLAAAHQGRPITAQEANEARAGLLLGFPSEFESVSAVSSKVTELAMLARPATWYSDWPRRVEAVTDAAVGRVAERASHREAYVVIVSGDYASVGPTFESIGLPIVRLDAQGNRLPPPKK